MKKGNKSTKGITQAHNQIDSKICDFMHHEQIDNWTFKNNFLRPLTLWTTLYPWNSPLVGFSHGHEWSHTPSIAHTPHPHPPYPHTHTPHPTPHTHPHSLPSPPSPTHPCPSHKNTVCRCHSMFIIQKWGRFLRNFEGSTRSKCAKSIQVHNIIFRLFRHFSFWLQRGSTLVMNLYVFPTLSEPTYN